MGLNSHAITSKNNFEIVFALFEVTKETQLIEAHSAAYVCKEFCGEYV